MRNFFIFMYAAFFQITELLPVLLAAVSFDGKLTNGLDTNESVITDCGSTLISREGNITFSSFDDDLRPWLHCDWVVILPEGSSAQLTFLLFDLPKGDNGHCKEGFLLLGTIDTNGNRKSELGPICGTESPGEISLSQNKFWVSMYMGSPEGGQRSHQYQGFCLRFTQVLPPAHESGDSSPSPGIDEGWYALIVIAGPLLCVIPLYFCLRRRRSVALYCADQDTSEMVVQRFRKKHRPHPMTGLGGPGNIQITISKPSFKDGDLSTITAYSYHGGSGDYENVKGHHKHRDDFHLFKNMYVRKSSFPSCDGSLESPVFVEESQNLNKTDLPISASSNFLTVPCRSTRNSRVSYLSILPDFESTLNNSRIHSTGYQQSPQPLSVAAIKHVDGKSVYVIQNQPTDKNKKQNIPTITITSASLRRKQRLSTVKNPEDTNSRANLIDRSTGQPFRGSIKPNRNAKVWQSVEDIPDESVNCSEPLSNPPLATEAQTMNSSPNTCFKFSTPAILQYRESIKNKDKKQNDLQTKCLFSNGISLQNQPEPSKTEYISETKYSEENQLNTQNSITSEMELLLHQQLNRPAQMGDDRSAFEFSDDGKESTQGVEMGTKLSRREN